MRRPRLPKAQILAEHCPMCDSDQGFNCGSLHGNGDLVRPHKERREAAYQTHYKQKIAAGFIPPNQRS